MKKLRLQAVQITADGMPIRRIRNVLTEEAQLPKLINLHTSPYSERICPFDTPG